MENLPALNAGENEESKAAALAARLGALAAQHDARLAEETEKVHRAMASTDPSPLKPVAVAQREDAQRRDLLDRARGRVRDELTSTDEYRALVKDLEAAAPRVAEAAEYYGKVLRLGQLTVLDSPQFSHYSAIVRGAGPATLQTLADQARATKNLALAVALSNEVSPLPVTKRPDAVKGLVEACMSPETKEKAARFARAAAHYGKARISLDRIRLGGRPTAASAAHKISAGLAARRSKANS